MKQILKEGKINKTEMGESGQTFLVKYNGNKSILRKCTNKKEADFYVSIYNKLERRGFLPRIIDRINKDILFEYIKGRNCKKSDALKVAYQIGKICGIIEKIKFVSPQKTNIKINNLLKIMLNEKVITKEKYRQILKKYEELKRRAKPKITMDINDLHPENFRIYLGKVYLVDIEAIKPRYKGRGIMKGFIKWFKTEKQRNEFKRGYNSISSMNFLKGDYEKFILLYNAIIALGNKIEQKKIYHKWVSEYMPIINKILEDEKVVY